MNIKVSIIIPTYNMEKYISECLDSIFQQTLDNYEVIVIDDGSTDNTRELISSKYSQNRIIYIYQENQGVGNARNKGIELAQGDYLLFIDPDDKYLRNDSVEKLYMAAVDNNAEVCGGNVIQYDGLTEKLFYSAGMGDDSSTKNGFIDAQEYYYMYGHWRYIYKTSLIDNMEIRYLNYKRFEDQFFIIRAIGEAGKVYELDYPVYWYRCGKQKVFSKDTWQEIFMAQRDTIKAMIDYKMKKMFMINAPFMVTRMVGKYRNGIFSDKSVLLTIAADIDEMIDTCGWEVNSFTDYCAIAEHMDALIRLEYKNRLIIIYGAGRNTERFLEKYGKLLKNRIVGIATTTAQGEKISICEIPVKDIGYYSNYKDDALVIITPAKKNCLSICKTLEIEGFSTYMWVDCNLLCE
ncbi:glycosyltransferase family 2 protein [Butyrivibrio sp. WCE2006]|uniref:glycosyltransferase family 2 protein n=1 Tax=Butyrivibrio sp. WCE2006 TaxID=1410611 RepID=UPI000679B06B|nr:glycosyltransferase family A protein [Butyrivibrio sp. WCE2006]